MVALQGFSAAHVGADNLNVVNHVGNIISGRWCAWPFPLVNGGDLLLQVKRMVRCRGRGKTPVTKVKGHAEVRNRERWSRDLNLVGGVAAAAINCSAPAFS